MIPPSSADPTPDVLPDPKRYEGNRLAHRVACAVVEEYEARKALPSAGAWFLYDKTNPAHTRHWEAEKELQSARVAYERLLVDSEAELLAGEGEPGD